ncbi:hypothetical protein [Streptomyces atratus]|uniref:Uncharacterized protein n=1 Tax=Streptomyces atratus TaxID=1893 RepID=A0A2Z5J849_STRAR|nr:hypothetical protein [Streptomyces atratus]AXE76095.1 hypothetical protein C5746_02930 [Streptomyces atratus]
MTKRLITAWLFARLGSNGTGAFGPGKVNELVLKIGQQLVKKGAETLFGALAAVEPSNCVASSISGSRTHRAVDCPERPGRRLRLHVCPLKLHSRA